MPVGEVAGREQDRRATGATMKFNEVKYQDAATKAYLGSPSIVRTPTGDLLVTHDYFGPGCPRNHEDEEHLTSVYRSSDEGATWTNVTHIAGAFWSNLFVHDGAMYLLGTSQQYGAVVIRRSEDNGNSWTHPRDADSGLLFASGPRREPPNFHCAPMPIAIRDGRIYRAFEDMQGTGWGVDFNSTVVSADADSDLLHADSWTMSNRIAFDRAWAPDEWGELAGPGWLEGNVIETPAGELVNILRFHSDPLADKAAVVRIHDEGRRISFDPTEGFIDLPGGMTKFTIRREPETGLYLTISNNNTDPSRPGQRNVLCLNASEDLWHWRRVATLIEDDLPLAWEDSMRLTGFQYVDWQFDGDAIIYLVRTAYDGSHNFHDANRVTFHRIDDFRKLLQGDDHGSAS